jgi:charged multivesicular body protein 7
MFFGRGTMLASMSADFYFFSRQETADLAVKKATGGNSSKLDLIYSKESFVEEFAGILNDATELSDADFDVLLLYLSRDSGTIAYDGKVS